MMHVEGLAKIRRVDKRERKGNQMSNGEDTGSRRHGIRKGKETEEGSSGRGGGFKTETEGRERVGGGEGNEKEESLSLIAVQFALFLDGLALNN